MRFVGPAGILPVVRFEKIWIEQCRATRAIKRRFGARSALDYLIGEKLLRRSPKLDHFCSRELTQPQITI